MKKIIIISLAIFLSFMFLIYCGIFRNYSNPIDVTKFYFACLKNREGFLTYQISKPEFFNEDKLGNLYKTYKMNDINRIWISLIGINNNYSRVETKITYKDKQFLHAIVELEMIDKIWKIKNIQYEYV